MQLIPFDTAHEDEVVIMIRQFHSEASYYNTEPFDEEVVRNYYNFCTYDVRGFGMIAVVDDVVVGFIAGVLVPMLFNNDHSAEDLSFYVAPEWRKKAGVSMKLVASYIDWAQSKGVRDRFIRLSVSAGVDNSAAGKFLERLGFTNVATSYALGSV